MSAVSVFRLKLYAIVLLASCHGALSAHANMFYVADRGGGAEFFLFESPGYPCFGGVPGTNVNISLFEEVCDRFEPLGCDWGTRGRVPAADAPGVVNFTLNHWIQRPGPDECSSTTFFVPFTYVDAPLVDSMSLSAYSIGPDNRVVTLEGAGFPINRGVEVWVGDVQAEVVTPPWDLRIPHIEGRLLQFLPPPFPGGDYPLTVDVRVVTIGGGQTVLEDAFTYDAVFPGFRPLVDKTPAWRTPFALLVRIDNYLEVEGYSFFIEDEELEIYCKGTECLREPANAFGIRIPPPYPPGYISLTVKAPDGAVQTLENGFRFTRTSPIHSADLNGDGVLSLSELLRVVQFYNAGAYHCAPAGRTSEDGLLPGSGPIPEDCRPHDSDLQTWDWRIDLSELLETIQLFNFGPYTLCPDQVLFCPVAAQGGN